MTNRRKIAPIVACLALLALSACANQIDAGVSQAAETPGFWWGLWHGFVFPFAWVGSLFDSDIAVYAVPFVLCMLIVVLLIAFVPAISTTLLPAIYQ